MRKFVCTLIVSTISVFCAFSQSAPSLLIPTDAVTLGRAGVTIAANPDAYALRSNPAMMSFFDGNLDAAFSYGMWQGSEAKKDVISFATMGKISEKLGLGVDFNYLGMPSYSIYNEQGIAEQVNGTFKPSELNVGLGISYKFIECLSAGVNLKIAASSLANSAKATAFAADIDLAFSKNGINAGLGVSNLGTKLKYNDESSCSLPSYLRVGVGYSISGITAQAEFDYLFSNAIMAGISCEYWYKEYVGIRAGFHYGDKAKAIPTYGSLGIGGQFKGVHLDLAYLFGNKILNNTLSVTLGYRF